MTVGLYAWLWRRLPGSGGWRVLVATLALAGVVGLLFAVVFPWAETHFPLLGGPGDLEVE